MIAGDDLRFLLHGIRGHDQVCVRELRLPEWEWKSVGDFYACDSCRRLIEGGDWKGLEDRAVATFHEHRPGLDVAKGRAFIRDVQAGFRRHRVTS